MSSTSGNDLEEYIEAVISIPRPLLQDEFHVTCRPACPAIRDGGVQGTRDIKQVAARRLPRKRDYGLL